MKNRYSRKCAAFLCASTTLLLSTNSLSHAATVSDLLITEIMANPAAVSDSNGEWFELFNPTGSAINLANVSLSDNGSNLHTISAGSDLFIGAGDYFVLGRNGDTSLNGGLEPDYVYSSFTLGNSSDQIILTDGLGNELRLEYTSGFTASGISTELTGLNTYGLTDSSLVYGAGDIGTPGMAGSYAPLTAVPLPASVWLLASGLLGLLQISRRS